MDDQRISKAWDKEYRRGKYKDDKPIPFVREIIETLESTYLLNGRGLYVGCGNGRNYIPLIRHELDLIGLDISSEALNQLASHYPPAKPKLIQGDFLHFSTKNPFDYLISIQIFQHGNTTTINQYFNKAIALLKPGGLFFLRVNSISTDIFFQHRMREKTGSGGFTITYTEGPKKGLDVHFYSEEEIEELTSNLQTTSKLHEVIMQREAPETSQWTQWEGIWRKGKE